MGYKSLKFIKELQMRGFKHCGICNKTRPLACFGGDKNKRNRLQSNCKECRKNKERERRNNPEVKKKIKEYKQKPENKRRTKDLALKRIFGLTIEQYDVMLKDQNNCCYICEGKEKTKRSLAVDHCHKTGKVRGLLCTKCNQGIGHLNDNIEYLKKAIEYLEKYK